MRQIMKAMDAAAEMHGVELKSCSNHSGPKVCATTSTSSPEPEAEETHPSLPCPAETRDDFSAPRQPRRKTSKFIDSRNLVKIGVELHQKGKYEKALWSFQEAIKSQILEYGSEHPIVAQTLANIGSVFLRQGRFLIAEDALKSALEIMEQARARCNSDEERHQIPISDVLNNLGNLAYLEGRYMKSMQFYRQNLRELRHRGLVDGDLADTLHNIGRLHVIRREWDAASSILAQCQQVEEKIYGSASPQVADTLELIGYVYLSQEYYDNAMVVFSEALTIHQRHFGAINENVATGLTNVAMVFGAQENLDAGIQTYQAAMDVFRSIPGVSEEHHAYRVACRGMETLKARAHAAKFINDPLPVRVRSPSFVDAHPWEEPESVNSKRREADHLFERRDF